MEKQTEKAIRIFVYTIVSVIIISMTFTFLVPWMMKKSLEKLITNIAGASRTNKPKIERNAVEYHEEKNEKQSEVKVVPPRNYRGTIYSWTDKKGKRIFSNTGFPKNGEYIDAKMEINE